MKKQNIEKIRHSLSHLMAMAVLEKFPKTQLGIGPIIENGFYYDFDVSRSNDKRMKTNEKRIFVENSGVIAADLPEIEKRIRELIKQNLQFKKEIISPAEAKKIFANQPYKSELIKELQKAKKPISIYKTFVSRPNSEQIKTNEKRIFDKNSISFVVNSGEIFVDLCAGPHISSIKEINPDAFKLTKISGAYWRGDEKNPMLTRVYGVAFENKKELDEHLKLQEEAEKRDHRKLGKDLDLFVFSDIVGKGLPLWTEKGAIIKRELERFIVDEEIKRGYKHVCTPDIAKVDLYRKSGHFPYYKDSMYPVMKVDEEELILRPMTCPHHFELYLSRPRSYKELPMRIAELAKLYRYEQSGELTGLIRVRTFCLADAHIICKDPKQAGDEIGKALDLIEYITSLFDFKIGENYWYRLSLGNRKDGKKYYKDDKAWDEAEKILKNVLKNRQCQFIEAKNEASFYGPKIDVQMKNIRGKEDTAFTVQYDFVMPKRFKLNYINEKGEEKEAVVVHRSSIGAIERIIAFLLEHTAGKLPLWLSPIQAVIINIGLDHLNYAEEILNKLKKNQIRAELKTEETVGKRIREAELQKIPYILVVGDKEIQNQTVNVRHYKRGQEGEILFDKLIEKIESEIKNKMV